MAGPNRQSENHNQIRTQGVRLTFQQEVTLRKRLQPLEAGAPPTGWPCLTLPSPSATYRERPQRTGDGGGEGKLPRNSQPLQAPSRAGETWCRKVRVR